MSKKILTPEGINFRPQLGEPSLKLCRRVLKLTNKNNLSNNWTETDAARYLLAQGWKAVSKTEIPADIKALLKPFYLDLDV